MSADNLAEGAFVSAVVRIMKIQNEMVELQRQLQQADADAMRANEAAMRELGFDESTDSEQIMDAQQRFMERAVAESGLPSQSVIVRGVRQQLRNMRQQYAEAVQAEADAFGSLNGPEL